MARVQRRFLVGSRWTALAPLPGGQGECHFEVTAVHGDSVTVRAVLTRAHHAVAIATLEDPAAWTSGWVTLPPAES